MTSSAQTPEPTDEQRAVARDALGPTPFNPAGDAQVDRVARALAAAVTAEREKALTAVDDVEMLPWRNDVFAEGYRAGTRDAARRIREVSR